MDLKNTETFLVILPSLKMVILITSKYKIKTKNKQKKISILNTIGI